MGLPARSQLLPSTRQITARVWSSRTLTTTRPLRQIEPRYPVDTQPEKPINFYKTHGRAFFKAITLAFLTYQIAYWAWLTLETEEVMDQKKREIKSLESEVRLLDDSRKSHRPGT
ncbi:hypothetical protein LTR10_019921 [Elasticomyces elasticus]|uniref:Inner membrane assembly complex subunit 17 n=1 Tax=Exophiala sideris TaxID=1016849 RepID=A0ABR0J9W2_9EURO|nr:hypothetical protein LTR10_019921 [Elasticomyces elasticus]KAK5022758.1 hypothetical protein LTS07_009735 [Exophiala sideris]KAK5026660.1 hypothetical protein LTR13_009883 [Exophiala sideris]KAK5059385.1 hypothetical protein LTR69_005973 [Exophiala sideris]KAK5177470.1 hypothetical protein LTR44_010087 [Eurotiomycetes sp. CCFEE 6388]